MESQAKSGTMVHRIAYIGEDPDLIRAHIRPKRFSVAKKRSGDFLGGSPILLMTKKAKAPLREPSYYSCANCIAAAQRFF